MWIKQLIHSIKTRRKLARWLNRQRAARWEIAHLNNHLQKDIGVNNLGSVTLLHWQQAPITTLASPGKPERGIPQRKGVTSMSN